MFSANTYLFMFLFIFLLIYMFYLFDFSYVGKSGCYCCDDFAIMCKLLMINKV